MAEHPLWGSISFRFLFPTITTIKSKVYPFLFKGADYCVNPPQLNTRDWRGCKPFDLENGRGSRKVGVFSHFG